MESRGSRGRVFGGLLEIKFPKRDVYGRAPEATVSAICQTVITPNLCIYVLIYEIAVHGTTINQKMWMTTAVLQAAAIRCAPLI